MYISRLRSAERDQRRHGASSACAAVLCPDGPSFQGSLSSTFLCIGHPVEAPNIHLSTKSSLLVQNVCMLGKTVVGPRAFVPFLFVLYYATKGPHHTRLQRCSFLSVRSSASIKFLSARGQRLCTDTRGPNVYKARRSCTLVSSSLRILTPHRLASVCTRACSPINLHLTNRRSLVIL